MVMPLNWLLFNQERCFCCWSLNGKWCIYIVPLSKVLYIACASHSPTHTFIHRWWCQPCKAPASTSGAIRGSMSCFNTDSGGAQVRICNLGCHPVTLPLSHCRPPPPVLIVIILLKEEMYYVDCHIPEVDMVHRQYSTR